MQVTAIKVALSTGTQNQKVDSVMAKPLKEQAFATPDKVAELVQKVRYKKCTLLDILGIEMAAISCCSLSSSPGCNFFY